MNVVHLLGDAPSRSWEAHPSRAECLTCGWSCSGPVRWVDQAICNEANDCGRKCMIRQAAS